MKAFLAGFNEVVPLHWLQFFDERELEVYMWEEAHNLVVVHCIYISCSTSVDLAM